MLCTTSNLVAVDMQIRQFVDASDNDKATSTSRGSPQLLLPEQASVIRLDSATNHWQNILPRKRPTPAAQRQQMPDHHYHLQQHLPARMTTMMMASRDTTGAADHLTDTEQLALKPTWARIGRDGTSAQRFAASAHNHAFFA